MWSKVWRNSHTTDARMCFVASVCCILFFYSRSCGKVKLSSHKTMLWCTSQVVTKLNKIVQISVLPFIFKSYSVICVSQNLFIKVNSVKFWTFVIAIILSFCCWLEILPLDLCYLLLNTWRVSFMKLISSSPDIVVIIHIV